MKYAKTYDKFVYVYESKNEAIKVDQEARMNFAAYYFG